MSELLIYFPAIYFFILLIYIIQRNGFDISACIVGVYLFTGICSVLLYYSDNRAARAYGLFDIESVTIVPTLIYCSMITLVVWPFIKFNSNKRRDIRPINVNIFNILSWCFICSFFFCLILFKDDIMFRLQMGDSIGKLRGDEIETAQSRLGGPLHLLSTIAVSICSVSSICFILFYYSTTYLKKSFLFNALLIISSLGCIIQGIMGIDRSISFYWILNALFIFVLFKPYIRRKTKRIIFLFGCGAAFGVGAYLVMLSKSRFGESAFDSLINYMGQNFINFCWFWNNYDAPAMNFGIFFPISSHFFIDWGMPVSAVSYGLWVRSKVGYFVNVFYTFMGTIMLYLGQWAVIPFCIIYNIIASKVLKPRKDLKFTTIVLIFIIAIVPYNGVILYLLVDYIKAFGFLFVILVCAYINRKKIINRYYKHSINAHSENANPIR